MNGALEAPLPARYRCRSPAVPLRRVTRQKSRLSSGEVAICLRVKEARHLLGLDQSEAARRIGVPPHTISNIEKCRAPVRFDIGLRLCRELVISEEWLATGEFRALVAEAVRRGIMKGRGAPQKLNAIFFRHCLDLWSEDLTLTIPPRTLLSEAFGKYLAPVNARLVAAHFALPRLVPNAHDGLSIRLTVLRAFIDRNLLLLGNEAQRLGKDELLAQGEYLRALLEVADVLYKRFMGLETPEVAEARFDFLRAIIKFRDMPIGSLHSGDIRKGSKRKAFPAGPTERRRPSEIAS